MAHLFLRLLMTFGNWLELTINHRSVREELLNHRRANDVSGDLFDGGFPSANCSLVYMLTVQLDPNRVDTAIWRWHQEGFTPPRRPTACCFKVLLG